MATTLTTDNIVEVPERVNMTTVEDTDNFLVYDVSEDVIKKITKAYLQETLGIIGQGQSWQTMTSKRSLDVFYYNTTSRPIMVAIGIDGEANVGLFVDDILVGRCYRYDSSDSRFMYAIIPVGSKYQCVSWLNTFTSWAELR